MFPTLTLLNRFATISFKKFITEESTADNLLILNPVLNIVLKPLHYFKFHHKFYENLIVFCIHISFI